jgi:hypothetical protein
MTEAEWLECPAIRYLEGRVSDRKLRLFACGCARQLLAAHFREGPRQDRSGLSLPDVVCPPVELAESFADGYTTADKVKAAHPERPPARIWEFYDLLFAAERAVDAALHEGAHPAAFQAGTEAALGFGTLVPRSPCSSTGPDYDWGTPNALARDIFGNPFRPITLAPAHRTPTVISLAQAAYDERQLPGGELDPLRLAVLADALEEDGAMDEVLAHLRSSGHHVRGCHVVDLCLGLS